ncbi:MAG: hypothetical protein KGI00_02550 [Candidatus Micrarchaeota archaeon]|nr:hypothetical protein [Candidatus Micrarchaeota archaeon]
MAVNFRLRSLGTRLRGICRSRKFTLPYPERIAEGRRHSFVDVIGIKPIRISSLEFNATFTAKCGSGYMFDEMVVLAANDISTWDGQEFGIRLRMDNGMIYGYIQDGRHIMSGNPNNHFVDAELIRNDGKAHRYRIRVDREGKRDAIGFWVDGKPRNRIVFAPRQEFTKQRYYVVMTTHRWGNGWDSGGSKMEVNDMAAYESYLRNYLTLQY